MENKTLDALKLTLLALQDIVHQLPNDENLANFNLDLVERAEITAKEVIAGTVPFDERTERQRVVDELINDCNDSVIVHYLTRNRSTQIDV